LLFPNPNKGTFKIQLDGAVSTYNYEIYDLFGRKVGFGTVSNESDFNIDLSFKNYKPGIYLLNLVSGADHLTFKVIIQ
jgi:hypothetical protein